MGAMASQITSLTIVYSTVYSGADQKKLQSSASLAFVWGIHRRPVNSPHKWPVTRKMFPFDDVIMRRAISQLRVSSHRLTIGTGRHLMPPIPDIERICEWCHLQTINDEQYFITGCDIHTIKPCHLYEIVQKYVPNFIAKNDRHRFVDIWSLQMEMHFELLESTF